MSFLDNADLGPGGKAYDGYLYWTSDGSKDRQYPPRSFSLTTGPKENRQKVTTDAPQTSGIVIDLYSVKVGWELNLDHMPKPERVLVPLGSPFPVRESLKGNPDDWSKCFSIPFAIPGREGVFLWEQAGVCFGMMQNLLPKLQASIREGLVPYIKATAIDEVKVSRGIVACPLFDVGEWVSPSQFFGASETAQKMQNTANQMGGGQQQNTGGGFGGGSNPAPSGGFGGGGQQAPGGNGGGFGNGPGGTGGAEF